MVYLYNQANRNIENIESKKIFFLQNVFFLNPRPAGRICDTRCNFMWSTSKIYNFFLTKIVWTRSCGLKRCLFVDTLLN